ncbi:MAG: glycosyltransferase family 4 protein [Terracidiphilus sp.]
MPMCAPAGAGKSAAPQRTNGDHAPVYREGASGLQRSKLAIIVAGRFLLFFRGCVERLRASGFDVSAISSPGPEQAPLVAEGATLFYVPMEREISPLHDLVALWRLWRLLRRVQPDLTNSGNPKAGLMGGLAAVLARVPCRIYALHGLRLETTAGLKRRILTWTERIACKCAHRVVCDSASLRQRAIDLGLVEAAKTRVITCHGIEIERYAATEENLVKAKELRRQLNLPKDSPVIGFVGRLTRDKGIPELAEAYWQLRGDFPSLRLLLVGDEESGDPVPPEVWKRIAADPLILRPGFVPDTAAYYQLMDIHVLPSWREGFGLVNIEAQAAGKPVVTTQATGAIDSVQDGYTGIVVPVGDASSLARALGELLRDDAKRREMGRRGQEWVVREFSRDKVMAALAEEYHCLIRERLAPRHRHVS